VSCRQLPGAAARWGRAVSDRPGRDSDGRTVIYLHRAAGSARGRSERRPPSGGFFRFQIIDVVCAMGWRADQPFGDCFAMAAGGSLPRRPVPGGARTSAPVVGRADQLRRTRRGTLFGVRGGCWVLRDSRSFVCVGTVRPGLVMGRLPARRNPGVPATAITMITGP